MIIPRRLLKEWPQRLALSFPYIFRERIFESIDHRFNTVVDVTECLMGVKVAACPGKVLVFEQSFLSQLFVEQKSKWGCDKFCNLFIYFIISLSGIPILG